jgi:hypothetical protein
MSVTEDTDDYHWRQAHPAGKGGGPWLLTLVSAKTTNNKNMRAMTRCAKEYGLYT